MIDITKVKIYRKYSGDIDAWSRIANDQEKFIMSDEDWRVIDDLINDLYLLKQNYFSEKAKKLTLEALNKKVASQQVIEELKQIVDHSI